MIFSIRSPQILLWYCISLTCSIRASPTLPPLVLNDNITAFNLTRWLNEPYDCFDARLFNSRRARISDCYRALASLPNYHESRTFVNGQGDPDLHPYLLPYTATKLGCQITVELVPGAVEEESTWLSINMAASKVILACQVGFSQEAKTGGSTRVGSNDHISVTVEKAQRASS